MSVTSKPTRTPCERRTLKPHNTISSKPPKSALHVAQRKRISDVYPFIEAVWHLCQAAQWQAAYDTLEQEHLFNDLNRWGGNAILLEIYQLLEPSDEWHPQPAQEAYIYVCLGRVYDASGQAGRGAQVL